MEFSLRKYHENNLSFAPSFSSGKTVSMSLIKHLEDKFKGYIGKDEAFEKLKIRTSSEYYDEVFAAQTKALAISESLFPAYKFIFPDMLMDDWLSIICPHKEGRRDHSLHQPLTAYIVSKLLGINGEKDCLTINDKSFFDSCVEMLIDEQKQHTKYLRKYFHDIYQKEFPIQNPESKRIWGKSVFAQASVMASLFHDIGYPWQFMNMLSKGTSRIELNGSFSREAQDVLSQIRTRLLIYPFYGYSESSVEHPISTARSEVLKQIGDAMSQTHGFPGALAFTYLNDSVSKYPVEYDFEGATVRFIQDWASVAIMMHDMPSQYRKKGEIANPHFRLRIDTDPLSCLIAMADILEEFGRPSAGFKAYTRGVVTRFKYPCEKTTVEVEGSTMTITYSYSKDCNLSDYRAIREREVQEYFNEKDGFIDLRPIGIEKVKCIVEHVDEK